MLHVSLRVAGVVDRPNITNSFLRDREKWVLGLLK